MSSIASIAATSTAESDQPYALAMALMPTWQAAAQWDAVRLYAAFGRDETASLDAKIVRAIVSPMRECCCWWWWW